MLTKNFYRLLQRTFYRVGKNTPSTMPKKYDGTENVAENATSMENMGRLTFGTNNAINFLSLCGIPDDISDEATLISTNSKKISSQNDGVLDSNNAGVGQWEGVYMIVGSGTTAPTKNDYKLESFIGSDVLQAKFCELSVDDGVFNTDEAINIITKAWTFQNISDSPVTVSEIGLVAIAVNNSTNIRHYLFYRDVLTSPVTIQPNGKYTFEANLTVK